MGYLVFLAYNLAVCIAVIYYLGVHSAIAVGISLLIGWATLWLIVGPIDSWRHRRKYDL